MRHLIRHARYLAVVLPIAGVALTGCASEPTVTTTTTTRTTTLTDPSTVVYPEGKYKLYGDGTTTPYYWVWIPAGATTPSVPPSPPPLPVRPTVAVQAPPTTVQTVQAGRYQLYGDGTSTPYYWVWVPTGAAPPPPPPLPLR